MKLRHQKLGSLVIKGEECIDKQPFQVAGEIVPSIQKEPLKTLERVSNSSVTDRQAEDDLKKKIKELIQKIDKSLVAVVMRYEYVRICHLWWLDGY